MNRHSRKLIALAAAALLLLCQAAYALQLCGDLAASIDSSISTCHGAADHQSDLPAPARTGECETAKAYSQEVRLPLLAVFEFPPLHLLPHVETTSRDARVEAAVATICPSPPLNLVHCRFLN